MHARLSIFLEEHNIIYTSQFGFQKNKSTLHSLIEITENIRSYIENKNYGCGVFIDLKNAFDTVNHSILLKKLEHYGVCGAMLTWFSSHLNDSYQRVSIMNKELKKRSTIDSNRLALNTSKNNFVISSPKNSKPVKSITLLMNRQAINSKRIC